MKRTTTAPGSCPGEAQRCTKTLSARPAEVKVWKSRLVENGPEVTQIRAPISSTREDRDGDEFSLAGLQSMVPALKSGKIPYYLDHGYKENGVMHYGALDMIGAWTNGEIEGSLLYGTAFLEPGNPLGAALADKLRAGLPVGHSVGFLPIRTRAKMDGGQIFDEVSLWEVSAVGIPSNPDAVSAALKSIRAKAGLRKAPADPAGRVVLTQSADGTVTAIPEAAFREATRAGIEKGLAPLNRQLEDLAGAKAAFTRAVPRGVVRKVSAVTPGGLIR